MPNIALPSVSMEKFCIVYGPPFEMDGKIFIAAIEIINIIVFQKINGTNNVLIRFRISESAIPLSSICFLNKKYPEITKNIETQADGICFETTSINGDEMVFGAWINTTPVIAYIFMSDIIFDDLALIILNPLFGVMPIGVQRIGTVP